MNIILEYCYNPLYYHNITLQYYYINTKYAIYLLATICYEERAFLASQNRKWPLVNNLEFVTVFICECLTKGTCDFWVYVCVRVCKYLQANWIAGGGGWYTNILSLNKIELRQILWNNRQIHEIDAHIDHINEIIMIAFIHQRHLFGNRLNTTIESWRLRACTELCTVYGSMKIRIMPFCPTTLPLCIDLERYMRNSKTPYRGWYGC